MEKNKLIIFAKQPKLGKVKTRLAASIGEEKTLKVYYELLAITKFVTSTIEVDRIVFWDHLMDGSSKEFEFGYRNEIQETGDLGFKMEIAFQKEFQSGAKKIIIIGTDCPFLTKEILQNAFAALDHSDFVLGPALDGGYYLLGMKEFSSFVFKSIPWSTEDVLSLTINSIEKNNKTVTLLDSLCDIDDIDDLKFWKGQV
ncbi:transferase 1, rSAM/selenodomain-associated [Leptospira wolbachii serovar Codice str. CDC]|uniref:Transferase 1, rSAM/selenodomain-associated n=1 Tax=Leptospira wolbachii serovar Codice str. CDC TaxID=1218599 RepID=R9A854_9LEPT|nr:TIGR04282 family arsenosugar biosynthesis glycosyltransferase [Leptospira wolbachii]EOQ98408.1 transferase 1, rSAM/selenodomain-associated [Leptospira wolbachii serovar Codice str. CDC]